MRDASRLTRLRFSPRVLHPRVSYRPHRRERTLFASRDSGRPFPLHWYWNHRRPFVGEGRGEGQSPAAPSRKNKPRWPSRREERLGSRHLRVVQRHLLFLPYNPYDIRYLRRYLPPSVVSDATRIATYLTHELHVVYMCTGGIIRHVIPARAARSFLSVSPSFSLAREDSSPRPARMFTFVSSGRASPDALRTKSVL